MEMNWIGLVLVVLGLYLAFKLIGVVLKLLMWLVVLVGAYWFVAPALGWPTLSDLVYVFGPDFEGQRIEEVFTPERIGDDLSGKVVDGVVERLRVSELPELTELTERMRPDAALPEEEPVEPGGNANGDGGAGGDEPGPPGE